MGQLQPDRPNDIAYQLILHHEVVPELTVIPPPPEDLARYRVDELGANPDALAHVSDVSLQ